jgi:hypothetical protein
VERRKWNEWCHNEGRKEETYNLKRTSTPTQTDTIREWDERDQGGGMRGEEESGKSRWSQGVMPRTREGRRETYASCSYISKSTWATMPRVETRRALHEREREREWVRENEWVRVRARRIGKEWSQGVMPRREKEGGKTYKLDKREERATATQWETGRWESDGEMNQSKEEDERSHEVMEGGRLTAYRQEKRTNQQAYRHTDIDTDTNTMKDRQIVR